MNDSDYLQKFGGKEGSEISKDMMPSCSAENASLPSPQPNQVIKRVFHTRTEFMVYPGGKIFPSKTQGWFEDHIYEVKKKEKAKPKEAKKINKSLEEVY